MTCVESWLSRGRVTAPGPKGSLSSLLDNAAATDAEAAVAPEAPTAARGVVVGPKEEELGRLRRRAEDGRRCLTPVVIVSAAAGT